MAAMPDADGGVTLEDVMLAAEYAIDRMPGVTPEERDAFIRDLRDELSVVFEHMPEEGRPTPQQVAESVRRHFGV
jgi:hypothetical protein